MITLYYKQTCPFGRRVLAVVERLEIKMELKELSEKKDHSLELEKLIGQKQKLCLVDPKRSIMMCESDDIVCYLQDKYGTKNNTPRPRVHISDSVCISCEG